MSNEEIEGMKRQAVVLSEALDSERKRDEYNGWANRETWAFWLHVTNDQGWYESVREFVQAQLDDDPDGPEPTDETPIPSDYSLGEKVVDYVRETLDELIDLNTTDGREYKDAHDGLLMMNREIGSWWRIDHREIGAAARDLASDS